MYPQQLQQVHPNLTIQWASNDHYFATRGYEIFFSGDEGKSWQSKGKIRRGILSSAAANPLIAQVGRLGIQSLLQLASKSILCIADGVLYRTDSIEYNFTSVFSEFTGRRPMRMGVCQDNLGRIFFGEYFFNREQKDVHLWRSDDDGFSWFPVQTWRSGKIRHIHFVQFDPYEQVIWVGTGDEDHECQVMYSDDGGENFTVVGIGSQLWRAGSLVFTPQAIYWGTDIGIDHNDQPNKIIRFDRATGKIDIVQPAPGPAYYSVQLKDGTVVIGTCVEQPNANNDEYIHILWSKDLNHWNDLPLYKKIKLPNIFGPAVIAFPLSDAPLNSLVFNLYLTRKFNGSLLQISLQR